MSGDYGSPERDRPAVGRLTGAVHRDARHDNESRSGGGASRPPLPGVVGAYRPKGPDGRGATVYVREVPASLFEAIRDRLKARQTPAVDGDLAGGLSQSAVVAAWLMATLHVRPRALADEAHLNRAADLLEEGLENAGITARMTDMAADMRRAAARLGRLESLAGSAKASGAAVEALLDYLAAWHVSPARANDDGVADRVDVTWPEAVRTGLHVRRDLGLPLDDDDDMPAVRRGAAPEAPARAQDGGGDDDGDGDGPSVGPHARIPGRRATPRAAERTRALAPGRDGTFARMAGAASGGDPQEGTASEAQEGTASEGTVPGEPAPEEQASDGPDSKETAADEPASEETVPGATAPGEPAQEEPADGETAADEPASEETAPGATAPGEPAQEEPADGEPAADEPASEETAAEATAPEKPAAGEAAPGGADPGRPARGDGVDGLMPDSSDLDDLLRGIV